MYTYIIEPRAHFNGNNNTRRSIIFYYNGNVHDDIYTIRWSSLKYRRFAGILFGILTRARRGTIRAVPRV